MSVPVEEIIALARNLLEHVGNYGDLLSRETIIAAEWLHRAYDTARGASSERVAA